MSQPNPCLSHSPNSRIRRSIRKSPCLFCGFDLGLPIFRALRIGASGPLTDRRQPPEPGVKYVSRSEMEQQNRNVLTIMSWQLDTRMGDGRTFREWYDEFNPEEMLRMMLDGRDRTFTMPDGRNLAKWTRTENEIYIDKCLQIAKLFG